MPSFDHANQVLVLDDSSYKGQHRCIEGPEQRGEHHWVQAHHTLSKAVP